ncbi:hypothetical protein ACFL1Q_00880 [Patescibacteria group bacterium]
MNKKRLIIFLIFLVIILLVFFLIKNRKKAVSDSIQPNESNLPQFTPPPSTPLTKQEDTSSTTVSGVKMRDFYKTASKIDEAGDMLLFGKEEYSIYFFPNEKHFLITILKSPFQEIRLQAEKEFLKLLDISEEDACKLNSNVVTPRFANSEEAGKYFKLSFCE